MPRNSLFSPNWKLGSMFQRGRLRRRPRRRNPSSERRGTFENLEPRLALAVDLGFAGVFQTVGGPASAIYSSSSPLDNKGGGMVTDGAGNRYVTVNGTFYDHIIDLDPGPAVISATMDAGLVKLDPNGAVLWTAPLNATGPNSPVVRINEAVDANQNVYLVGDFRGTIDVDPGPGVVNVTSTGGGTDYGVYMSKLNSAGQLQWVRTLAANELTPFRIAVDGAGNLVIASIFTATTTDPAMDVDAGPGQFLVQKKGPDYDMVVLKYSTDGEFMWSRQWGDAGASQFGNVPTLGVDGQGDVFVCGAFKGSLDLDPTAGVQIATNSDTTFDRFVVRLDPTGNFVWSYATEGPGQISFRDIEFEADGSIILGGFFTGTTDFQPGAGSLSLTSTGSHANGLVVKLNNDSTVAWARQFGGQGEIVTEVDLDQDGNIYLGGSIAYPNQSGQTSDFDPGPGIYELVAPSTNETAFVLSLTEGGDFRWAVPLGGNTGRSQVQGIGVTPNGDVHVSGAFRGNADFNPSPVAETWLSSSADQSVFTATLTQVAPNPGAPVVDAGASQTIVVTSSANLHGTVTDDGLPNPVTTTWSLVSGPGTVTFGNASALDTTATFSTSGSYWLQLVATDTQFMTTDYVHIVVNPVTATLTAAADTYIDGGSTTTNFGASASLVVDGNPDDAALLRWDLSSIPVGSTLQSATLSVNVTGTSADTYEIYELKRSWTELQATWKKATSVSNWQSAGAQGTLDRGSTVLGTVTASATGVRNVVLNAAGLAVVQGWVNNPATNFGFILQDYANTTKDDLVFSSKEAMVAANRPQFQLVYNPPNLPVQALASSASFAAPAAAVMASPPVVAKAGNTPAATSGVLSTTENADLLAAVLADRLTEKPANRLATWMLLDDNDDGAQERHAAATGVALAALGNQFRNPFAFVA